MKFALIFVVSLFSFNVWAGAAADKAAMDKWNSSSEVTSSVKLVKEKCGATMTFKIDSSFLNSDFVTGNKSVPGFCQHPFYVWNQILCKTPAYKDAISKFKTYTCKHGQGKELTLAVSGGDVTMTIGKDASNVDDQVKNWFEKNL